MGPRNRLVRSRITTSATARIARRKRSARSYTRTATDCSLPLQRRPTQNRPCFVRELLPTYAGTSHIGGEKTLNLWGRVGRGWHPPNPERFSRPPPSTTRPSLRVEIPAES